MRGILHGQPIAAEDIERFLADLIATITSDNFGNRCLFGDILAPVRHGGAVVGVEMGLLKSCQHINQFKLHRLKTADGLAELLAFLSIFQGSSVGCFGVAECNCGGNDSIHCQHPVGAFKIAFFTTQTAIKG